MGGLPPIGGDCRQQIYYSPLPAALATAPGLHRPPAGSPGSGRRRRAGPPRAGRRGRQARGVLISLGRHTGTECVWASSSGVVAGLPALRARQRRRRQERPLRPCRRQRGGARFSACRDTTRRELVRVRGETDCVGVGGVRLSLVELRGGGWRAWLWLGRCRRESREAVCLCPQAENDCEQNVSSLGLIGSRSVEPSSLARRHAGSMGLTPSETYHGVRNGACLSAPRVPARGNVPCRLPRRAHTLPCSLSCRVQPSTCSQQCTPPLRGPLHAWLSGNGDDAAWTQTRMT